MKHMMAKKIRTLLAVLAFSCVCTITYAQGPPGDPGDDPGGGTTIPIDGGLGLLIAAGVGFAAKKGYDKRKKENVLDK